MRTFSLSFSSDSDGACCLIDGPRGTIIAVVIGEGSCLSLKQALRYIILVLIMLLIIGINKSLHGAVKFNNKVPWFSWRIIRVPLLLRASLLVLYAQLMRWIVVLIA